MALLKLTLSQYLERAVTEWPAKVALIQAENARSLSWSELDQSAEVFGRGLLRLGLKRGDCILLWTGNQIEWCIAFFAAAKHGIVPVAVCQQLESEEVRYALKATNARAILFADGYKGRSYEKLLRAISGEHAQYAGSENCSLLLIHTGKVECAAAIDFNALLRIGSCSQASNSKPVTCDPTDVGAIVFSSGSTSHPKAVMLTNLGLVNNSYGTARRLGLRSADILCNPMSLAHCFGMVSGLLACVATGATAVLLESSRAEDIVSCVKRYNCTALHGVPTIFHRLLDHLAVAGEALHGVRTGIVAGAACSESLMRSIVDELGMKEVAVAYGQTETSPGCTQTSASDPLERKINTIGTPLPFVEMCVKAPSSGCPCATGERGELCTRGYHVMRGYLNDPQQTRTVIDPDGWLHSGDIGYADESGYYHFDSRLKELIIRGGENISPEEVEAAIITHPEVCDAKVFGVPSAVYGEEVAAFVQLKDGAAMMPEEMARYLNGKIAYFKIPVHFEFGFEMKTTPSGKVDVRQLREQMMSMLASGK